MLSVPCQRIGDRFQLPQSGDGGKEGRRFRPDQAPSERPTDGDIEQKPVARLLGGIEGKMITLASTGVEVHLELGVSAGRVNRGLRIAHKLQASRRARQRVVREADGDVLAFAPAEGFCDHGLHIKVAAPGLVVAVGRRAEQVDADQPLLKAALKAFDHLLQVTNFGSWQSHSHRHTDDRLTGQTEEV